MIRDHRAAVAVPIDPWPVGARSETGEGGPGRDGTGGRLGAQRRSVLTRRPPLVIVARGSCHGGLLGELYGWSQLHSCGLRPHSQSLVPNGE